MPQDSVNQRPMVSVVLATLNEGGLIRKCMASLLEQETPDFDLEILAVDGLSTDGTREYLEKVAAADPRVKVLVNEKKRTPFAFNLGLREAKGEYVCIFGSHAVYEKDYISVCLKELLANGAGGCGGRVVTEPASDSLQAHLVACTMAHPFGSSRNSFRTQPEGFGEGLGYLVIRKEALLAVGGYSEELLRNQDNDANQKLRASGQKFYCTWKTHCFYYPKSTVNELLGYAYGNGFWNVISLKGNASSMSPRHFVPFIFVMSLLLSALLALSRPFLHSPYRIIAALPLAAVVAVHLSAGSIATCQVLARTKFRGAVWLPLVFFAFHFSYGLGTLWALLTRAKPPVSVAPQSLVSDRV
jgi:succinoglycan biosynthesis protein ExoA